MIVKGLGNIVTDSFGRTIDCSYFMNVLTTPQCWNTSDNLAPPPAPSGSVLVTPPANGDTANATVNSLLNQQLVDQQSINASNVSSSWMDTLAGNLNVSAPWLLIGLALGGMFLISTVVGGGSPRRYGR